MVQLGNFCVLLLKQSKKGSLLFGQLGVFVHQPFVFLRLLGVKLLKFLSLLLFSLEGGRIYKFGGLRFSFIPRYELQNIISGSVVDTVSVTETLY